MKIAVVAVVEKIENSTFLSSPLKVTPQQEAQQKTDVARSKYINPYYWVDDHPLLYGNNGSLDPGTDGW